MALGLVSELISSVEFFNIFLKILESFGGFLYMILVHHDIFGPGTGPQTLLILLLLLLGPDAYLKIPKALSVHKRPL